MSLPNHQKHLQLRLNLKVPKEKKVWDKFQTLKEKAEKRDGKDKDKAILSALITGDNNWLFESVPVPPSQRGLHLKIDELIQSILKMQSIIEAQSAILTQLQNTDFTQYVNHNGVSAHDVLDDKLKALGENFKTHVTKIEFEDD